VFQKCYTGNILGIGRNKSQYFPELDETKARRPDISWSFQKTEEETEPSQRAATP
jgi:hypothetical protein